MTVLAPWAPRNKVTTWHPAKAGATVAHYLGLAEQDPTAERVMLCGPPPVAGWLLVPTPGWEPLGHYLDLDTPVGRFRQTVSGRQVEIRRAAEWFGETVTTPDDCRYAWALLAAAYSHAFRGATLFDSPGATGMDAWLRSTPTVTQLSPELAELVRTTSPQHRVELLEHDHPLEGFAYLDGRFQYAALVRELGTAPAVMLTGREALEHSDAAPYGRARYHVRGSVPAGWDHLGLFMCKDPAGGWHAPRTPGRPFDTWADAAEVTLARRMGWSVEFLAGIQFASGRPLDTWRNRVLAARDYCNRPAYDPTMADAARHALRAILLRAIGSFHSTGRDVIHVVTNPIDHPRDGAPLDPHGDVWTWRQRVPLAARAAAMTHPEYSAQVWARSHVRILESPTGDRGRWAGAMQLPLEQIVGIRGDALYLTRDPEWPDDGLVGRLRLKGHLAGPIDPPTNTGQLNHLRAQAEAHP